MNIFVYVLLAAIFLLLFMAIVLAIEVFAAICVARPADRNRENGKRDAVAVLVPAHNEEYSVGAMIKAVSAQLETTDRLIVIADNCTDDTARVAAAHGAEVAVRIDADRRGKGYALQFGMERLSHDPRPTVIIIDADCMVGPDTIDLLCETSTATGKPVQSLNLIEVEPDAPIQQKISAFAFRVKNQVRFEGLRRLGFGCPLAGTGMAFPWQVIHTAQLASGNIVEDMKLGVDLAIAGHPAIFEPRALVTSHFPDVKSAAQGQRQRWEHGHVQTIINQVPRLLAAALRQGRPALLVMAFDLAILPLSLLVVLNGLFLVLSAIVFLLSGELLPLILSLATGLIIVLSVIFSWRAYGRDVLSSGDFLKIPLYVMNKIPIYLRLLYKQERHWKRTTRDNENDQG